MGKPNQRQPFALEFDPVLVEQSVLLRIRGHPEERRFWRARDPIFEVADADAREQAFCKLHAEWFQRLRIAQPIYDALADLPEAVPPSGRCFVLAVPSADQEGADLREWRAPSAQEEGPSPALLIQLQPWRLLDIDSLRIWLRRELLHVADMLDPRFGYQPELPADSGGPALAHLLRERYRVLWNVWVDGRLARRGWLPQAVREERWMEFQQLFPDLGAEPFQNLYESDAQTHAFLMALARNPQVSVNSSASVSRPRICPLCRFPSFRSVISGDEIPPQVRDEIARDFPDWTPGQGLCRQCADLFQSRSVSRAAEAALPGMRPSGAEAS